MSNRIPANRLATIPDFLKAHPGITENQLRWALRNRDKNGLAPHVYRRESWNPITLLLDPVPVARWFERTVRA